MKKMRSSSLFWAEEGFSTVGMVLALLISISLIFTAARVYEINSCSSRVQEVADAVQAVGYDGPACLELFRPEYWRMPAEDVIRMGAENTRPFLA